MEKLVGIDALGTYVPQTLVELVPEDSFKNKTYEHSEFSRKREFSPVYIGKGLGLYQFGWPDGHEDPVTMGAMAAKQLIEQNDIELSEIGRIFLGTETPVDHSKPGAMYIAGALERSMGKEGEMRNCTPLDFKFACAGTTAALELLCEWVESGKNNGKYGLAIATDISSYPLGFKEEITQGAGAVAMLVKENPRLLAIENGVETAELTSTVCFDEKDFFRPIGTHTAVVDGPLSVDCYLNTCKEALTDYRKKAVKQGLIKDGEILTDQVDRILFHLPYAKMGENAAAALFINEWRDDSRFEEIVREIGPEAERKNYNSEEDFQGAKKVFRRSFRDTDLFKETFSEKVEKGTRTSRRTGNTYTGSLYMAFDSMLESELKDGIDLAGKRFAFGSYGSGCIFKTFVGTIQPEFKEVVKNLNLFEQLDERRNDKRNFLSIEDYETKHENYLGLTKSIIEPDGDFVLAKIGDTQTDKGYRYYDFV